MKEEIKLQIEDPMTLEADLLKLGAIFLEEIYAKDTYFNQPEGRVVKITDDNRGIFLVELYRQDGKWQIQSRKELDHPDKEKQKLTERYGLKCVLIKKRRFYKLNSLELNINLIKDVGKFLIAEGENLTREQVIEQLKINSPKFITESFDNIAAARHLNS